MRVRERRGEEGFFRGWIEGMRDVIVAVAVVVWEV